MERVGINQMGAEPGGLGAEDSQRGAKTHKWGEEAGEKC